MQKNSKKNFIVTGFLFLIFLLFTVLIKTIDVKPVGPNQSEIGFASLNLFLFDFFGVNLLWYNITCCLGGIAILFAFGFAVAGLCQLIKRKHILKVDFRILAMGGLYALVVFFYVFFELVIINYRPILMDTELEASYPSSHIMLTVCIMAAAALQFRQLFGNKLALLIAAEGFCILLIAGMLIGRLLSGVHWFTDIAAGVLLASALVMLYYSAVKRMEDLQNISDCHQ